MGIMHQKDLLTNSSLDTTINSKELRIKILDLVKLYTDEVHKKNKFIPGKTLIPVSGKIYDENEIKMLISRLFGFLVNYR